MSARELARAEIRELVPYASPAPPPGYARLNANESATSPIGVDPDNEPNRYPEMRPLTLRSALAGLFDVEDGNLCPVRGSSEGIDLLIRSFCKAYTDNIIVMPPTFEMYAAYGRMHGAEVRELALTSPEFSVDWSQLDAVCDANTKIVFFCSPNNPTGNSIPAEQILELAARRRDKSLIVVDEAYIEFAGHESLTREMRTNDNLVVLRTLSKAWSLAGLRCGAVVADAGVADVIAAMSSPYAIAEPVTRGVLAALEPPAHRASIANIRCTVDERNRVSARLSDSPLVSQVWPSDANFVLFQAADPRILSRSLEQHEVMVRNFESGSPLAGCVRVTIGSESQNNRFLAAIASAEKAWS